MRLKEVGEFGLINRIASRVENKAGVRIGIGDDAAAIEPSTGCVTLVTADMLLEGVHFDLALTDPVSLGRKSLAVNLSDIAAMGAKPRHCLLSLGIPQDLPVEFIDSFVSGLLQRAAEFDVALIGGDTCSSRGGLVISVTLIGEQRPELVIRRSGAQQGDLVVVTGTLGDSALGLELLRNGERAGSAVLKHLDPSPRVKEGFLLADAGLPTAMIDVSDGLLADLGHILELSGKGASIQLEKLPLSPAFTAHMRGSQGDPFLMPLAGGEDYELLFTVPPEKYAAVTEILSPLATQLTVLGEITATGLKVIGVGGEEYRVPASGYNHFSSVN